MEEPLLEFRKTGHRFADGVWGLKDINLPVFPRELLIIAGANGAGKTLLMRHAIGLTRPSEGSVLVKGSELTRNLSLARRSLGLVFQHPEEQFIEDTVYDEIAFGPQNHRIQGEALQATVVAAMEQFGLGGMAQRHPLSLSGGERRRLALASVVAMRPELLILDEPFMELDYPGIKTLLSMLIDLHRSGQAICVITHDIGKILAHADRLVLLSEGRLVAQGPPAEILPLCEENGVRNPCRNGAPIEEATWI